MDQLLQIALGCIFYGWREPGFSATKAAELLLDLWKYCVRSVRGVAKKDSNHPKPLDESWLGLLAKAAENNFSFDAPTQKEYTRLFNYGRRRCPSFLGLG